MESVSPAEQSAIVEINRYIAEVLESRIGGCKVGEFGLGAGQFAGGAAIEFASGLAEAVSAGTLTPAAAVGLLAGAANILEGAFRMNEACAAAPPFLR